MNSKESTPDAFMPSSQFNALDRKIIWLTVSDVTNQAEKYRDKMSKSHWIIVVVTNHMIRTLRPTMIRNEYTKVISQRPRLMVMRLIEPLLRSRKFMPTLRRAFSNLGKKIDYANRLGLSSSDRFTLERR